MKKIIIVLISVLLFSEAGIAQSSGGQTAVIYVVYYTAPAQNVPASNVNNFSSYNQTVQPIQAGYYSQPNLINQPNITGVGTVNNYNAGPQSIVVPAYPNYQPQNNFTPAFEGYSNFTEPVNQAPQKKTLGDKIINTCVVFNEVLNTGTNVVSFVRQF
mgnify:CR=1 FL=1